MLYPQEKKLTPQNFQNPPQAYHSIPFFAWNCRLNLDLLREEIDCFAQMGFGGFCIHVRTGLETPYLGKEFLEDVRACEEYGKQKGMRAWLYDEDRWPSGAAGGEVTKDMALRSRHLLFTPVPYGEDTSDLPSLPYSRAGSARTENGRLLCRYEIQLAPDGTLQSARKLMTQEPAGKHTWYAYLETQAAEGWYNHQTYVDTLNPKAAERFLSLTHETYQKLLGRDFGQTVPAIFCDEPQTPRRLGLSAPDARAEVTLPWTDDLPDSYRKAYGRNIWDDLPLLFWNLPGNGSAPARWYWHRHLTERFAAGFLQPCGDWCRQHGLLFTGHLMEEPTLQGQTETTGDVMRCYRDFGLPGVDMLCGNFEYTTVKQCASVKNQMGRPGMLSETYGVTGWDFDFRSQKLHGDWQAALGVTQRVLHLAWAGMAGESKRDYPATYGYQAPWHCEFSGLEAHFARLNEALTRGNPVVYVAVLHPIESFWLVCGPAKQTSLQKQQMEHDFQAVTRWLLLGGVDFDFLSEALLPELCPCGGAPLQVGEMRYDLILVPACVTLRETTLHLLEAYHQAGGELIFLGAPPEDVDAKPDERPAKLAKQCRVVPFDRQHLLEAVEPVREISLRGKDGCLTDNLVYQMRQDGRERWLFLSHAKEPDCHDNADCQEVNITLRGEWTVQCWNTMTGAVREYPAERKNGKTRLYWGAFVYDSLLLKLTPAPADNQPAQIFLQPKKLQWMPLHLPLSVPYSLQEPNCLLLDSAEFALDGEAYQPAEELLRVDNQLRRRLSLPLRTDSAAQPWAVPEKPPRHTVRLRFAVQSDLPVTGALLTMEEPEHTKLWMNGKMLPVHSSGWFVDHAIHTVPLPQLHAGKTVLEEELPFGERTNLEWQYLLGSFGVKVSGTEAKITNLNQEIHFGDITGQGLPFYGGNLTYQIPFTLPADGELLIYAPHYRGHLMTFTLDGGEEKQVFLPPCEQQFPAAAGRHTLCITLFGSRFNQFGPLHLFDTAWRYMGPASWRTEDSRWSDAWQFRPSGVLSTPQIYFCPERKDET